MTKIETLRDILTVMKLAEEVNLTQVEIEGVMKHARAYLNAELNLQGDGK